MRIEEAQEKVQVGKKVELDSGKEGVVMDVEFSPKTNYSLVTVKIDDSHVRIVSASSVVKVVEENE